MPKDARRQRGFSLIELLLVVAIIGIVASIAVPRLMGARAAAQQAAAVSALRTLYSTQLSYASTNGRYGRLFELNQLNNGNFGEQAGPTLRRQGYVFQTVPTVPSDAQLARGFTIAATGQYPDGTLAIFTVDETGVISQISP